MWKLLNGLYRLFDREPETQEQEDVLLMSRRGFLKGLSATAVLPLIPFNRVWSFPTIIPPDGSISIAFQLEKIRHLLPVLYERNDRLFGLLSYDDTIGSVGPYMGISRERYRMPLRIGD